MGYIKTTIGALTRSTYTNMKGIVIVLACVVGMAYGQGRAITSTIGGTGPQQAGVAGAGGVARPAAANNIFNPITTPIARTCGQWQSVCYGQGLNSLGVTPVNAFQAQCQARVAQTNGFLLRIDPTGQMFITNRFGQPLEDVEFEIPQQFGFGGANQFGGAAGANPRFNQQQQQLITQTLKAEQVVREVELRCLGGFGQ